MPVKSKRGFASFDKEKMQAVASAGGKAAHQSGSAHQWTSEQARAANAKSLEARKANKAAQAAATPVRKPFDVSG